MGRAIELSRLGFPAPNPHVGCVVVRNGRIVGEGHHEYAGGPHAEAAALGRAGASAKGAEVYVTLEPCNHVGRTGPCSEALIAAGVATVVYAVADPNPRAAGGAARLREANVTVVQGLMEQEAIRANEPFLEAMRMQRPFVSLKAAMSLDGKIALPDGRSKWITGPEARLAGQKLRAEMGAVLVGANTVLQDDPSLAAPLEGVVNQPLRVVLDAKGRAPSNAMAFADRNFVHYVARAQNPAQTALPAQNGFIEPLDVLEDLWKRGVTSLLVEGGGATLGAFLAAGLFERVELFIASLVIGHGISWSGDYRVDSLEESLRLKIQKVELVGEDIRVSLAR